MKQKKIEETIPNTEEELYAWFAWYDQTHPEDPKRDLNPKYANNIMPSNPRPRARPRKICWDCRKFEYWFFLDYKRLMRKDRKRFKEQNK